MIKIFKTILTGAMVILPLFIAAQNKTITVKGNVQFNEPKFKMELYRFNGNEKVVVGEFDVDANNNYEFKFEVKVPGLYHLDCKKWERISFWAEDENVTINFRGADTAKIKIKNPPFHMIYGGPKNEVINQYNFLSYRNYQQMIAISQAGYRAKFVNEKQKDSTISALYESLNEDMSSRVRFLADMYSDRTSVITFINMLDPKRDAELINKITKNIFDKYPGYAPLTALLKDRKAKEELAAKVAIGVKAPDFEYSTVDGKKFGPASFKGKILIIDFWASWCGPCRAEIPNLKKTYEKFKNSNVAFLSVSIDKDTNAWKKALSEEKMPWNQVLAPEAGKEITQLYQFSGIPFIIMIDSEGKIYRKQLRGEKIEQAIEELLKK
jgi:thiol-disulfide isomerase/thioredoxin